MSCYPIIERGKRVGTVSISPSGRLHVGNRYFTVAMHDYCGPTFYRGRWGEFYEPEDENDPIWDAFEKWDRKRNQNQRGVRDEQDE